MPFTQKEIHEYQFGHSDTDSTSDSSVDDEQYAYTFSIPLKILNATNPKAKRNGNSALAFHSVLHEDPILSHISIYLTDQDLFRLALVDRPCARAVFAVFSPFDEVWEMSSRERTDLLRCSALVGWFPADLDFCVGCKMYRRCKSIQRYLWRPMVNRNPEDARCIDCRRELYDAESSEEGEEEEEKEEGRGEDEEEEGEEGHEEGVDEKRIDHRMESDSAKLSEEKDGREESLLERAQADTSQAEMSRLFEVETIGDETLPTALSELSSDDEDKV